MRGILGRRTFGSFSFMVLIAGLSVLFLTFCRMANAAPVQIPASVQLKAQLSGEGGGNARLTWGSQAEDFVLGTSLGEVSSRTVRWRKGAKPWSEWLATNADRVLEIGGVSRGQSIDIEGKMVVVSASGKTSKFEWNASSTVIPAASCTPPEKFLSLLSNMTGADAIAFSTPVSASELEEAAALAGVRVLGAIRQDKFANGTTYTSGVSIDEELPLHENLESANDAIVEELGRHAADNEAEARAIADESEDGESTDAIQDLEQESEGAEDLKDKMITEQAFAVTQIAFEHDDAVMAKLLSYFGSKTTDAYSEADSDTCFTLDPSIDLTQVYPNAGDLGTPSQDVDPDDNLPVDAEFVGKGLADIASIDPENADDAQADAMVAASKKPKPVGNIRTFTPNKITLAGVNSVPVKRFLHTDHYRRATVSWRWCEKCVSFWKKHASGRRGVEIQMDMGNVPADPNKRAWGLPLWSPIQGGTPRTGSSGQKINGVPQAWTANFPCPYLDDYFSDDLVHKWSLTIGQGCPPTSSAVKQKYTSKLLISKTVGTRYPVVIKMDNHDLVMPSVQPVLYAASGNNKIYCKTHKKRLGSCMFQDPQATTEATYHRKIDVSKNYLKMPNPGGQDFIRDSQPASASHYNSDPAECPGQPDVAISEYVGTKFRWCGTKVNVSLAPSFAAASCSMMFGEWGDDGHGNGHGLLLSRKPIGMPTVGPEVSPSDVFDFIYNGYAKQFTTRKFTLDSSDFPTESDPTRRGDPVFVQCFFFTPILATHIDEFMEKYFRTLRGDTSMDDLLSYVESIGGSLADLDIAGNFLASPALHPDLNIDFPRDCRGDKSHPNSATFVFGAPGVFDPDALGQDCSGFDAGDNGPGGGPTGGATGETGPTGDTGGPTDETGGPTDDTGEDPGDDDGPTGGGNDGDDGSSEAAVADVNENITFDWTSSTRALTVTNHSAQSSVACLTMSAGWGDDGNGHDRGTIVLHPDSVMQTGVSDEESITIVGYDEAEDGDVLVAYCLAGSGPDFETIFNSWVSCVLAGDSDACETLGQYAVDEDYFLVWSDQFSDPNTHLHDCDRVDQSAGVAVFVYGSDGPYSQSSSGQVCSEP